MQTLILQVWVGPTFLKFPGDTVHLPEVYTLRSKALVNHNGSWELNNGNRMQAGPRGLASEGSCGCEEMSQSRVTQNFLSLTE